MILNNTGTIIIGSLGLQTSVADAEILPYSVSSFELANDQECTISVNGGAFVYIRALQGLSLDYAASIRIHEDAKTFNWIAVKR